MFDLYTFKSLTWYPFVIINVDAVTVYRDVSIHAEKKDNKLSEK